MRVLEEREILFKVVHEGKFLLIRVKARPRVQKFSLLDALPKVSEIVVVLLVSEERILRFKLQRKVCDDRCQFPLNWNCFFTAN